MKLPKTAINIIETEHSKKIEELNQLQREINQFQNILNQKQQSFLTLKGAIDQLNELLENGRE